MTTTKTTNKRKSAPRGKRITWTIPQGIETLLIQVGRDMGTDDLKEVLSFILWDIKRHGYKYHNGLRVIIPTTQTPPPQVQPVTQPVTIQAPPPVVEPVEAEAVEEIDPVIQRLLSLGLDDF
jgi:hypothetical protein